MGKIVRYITTDGSAFVVACDSTDMIAEAERIHKPSAPVTAGIGRLLTAASMMGVMLKGKDDDVTLRFYGNGPAGPVTAISDSQGNGRVTVQNPIVELPLNDKGKLDVSGALGKSGFLYVVKNIGLKEPFVGTTEIISGEVAEDITNYYAVSEQTPTVCSLGVLINPDLTVKCAGGFLIQLLPGCPEETISAIESSVSDIPSVTQMLTEGFTPDDIAKRAMNGLCVEKLDESHFEYKCSCSREKACMAIISSGKEAMTEMSLDSKPTTVECHFCDKTYSFTPDEIKKLLKKV